MKLRRGLAAAFLMALAVVLASCGQSYDLEEVRARADEMYERVLEAYYLSDSCGEELRMAEIVAEYDDLADPELARYIARERDRESDPREKKRLGFLYHDIVGTIVFDEIAEESEEITNIEAAGTVVVRGDTLPYRDVGVLFYNETDSGLREDYYHAMGRFAAERTNPVRRRLVDRTRELLGRFGYEDLEAFEEERRSIDFGRFEATVEAFLEETDDIYRSLTDEASFEVFGTPAAEVADYDRGRIFRGAEYDVYFPAEGMMPLLRKTLLGLGIDLDELPMIAVDDEDRPGKEPRAACYSIRPGEDVRILMKPGGGASDYETLFHEMGHALHDAFVVVGEYEFQRLGDYGTTETYAFLPEGLISDEAFLIEHELVPDEKTRRGFLRNRLLADLGTARYYAGLFSYERLLHRGGFSEDELTQAYGRLMEAARLCPLEHPEYGYLSSNEDFYGVNYLEAWFLTAQLRAALTERFGRDWWRSAAAGELLKDLWSYGSELSPNEVARLLGFEGLDSAYYVREVRTKFERTAPGGRAAGTGFLERSSHAQADLPSSMSAVNR